VWFDIIGKVEGDGGLGWCAGNALTGDDQKREELQEV
jgi:hypothetical protein